MADDDESGVIVSLEDKMERFTAYLSVSERRKLRGTSREQGTSENHVLRSIIRQHYGLNAPNRRENV